MTYLDDPPLITVISTTSPRAQRTYKCDVCHSDIRPRESHVKLVYLDDESGKFRSVRYHHVCPWEADHP